MIKRGPLIGVLLIGLAALGFWFLYFRPVKSVPNPAPATPDAPLAPSLSEPPTAAKRTDRPVQEPAAGAEARREAADGFLVRGFVTNAQGAPLTGVKVSLGAACAGDTAWTSTSTDSLGFYQIRLERFQGVERACLRLDRGGFSPVSEWLDPSPDWQKKDFQLAPTDATLRGRVLDHAGAGLGGALVSVSQTPAYPGFRNFEPSFFETVTEDSGGYRLAGLPRGPVRVVARKDGFTTDSLGIELAVDEDGWLNFELRPIRRHLLTVVGPDGTGLPQARLETAEQGTFPADESGVIDYSIAPAEDALLVPCRVTAEGYLALALDLDPVNPVDRAVLRRAAPLRGRVLSEDGSPVAGAFAAAVVRYRQNIRLDPPARTDDSGWFELYPSDQAPVAIHVRHRNYLDTERKLEPDRPDYLEVRLARPTAGIRGRFLDSSGNPFGLVGVTLTCPEAGREQNRSFTEPDGSFFVFGLEEGLYRLKLQGFAEGRVETAVVENVEVSPGRVTGPILAIGRPVEH